MPCVVWIVDLAAPSVRFKHATPRYTSSSAVRIVWEGFEVEAADAVGTRFTDHKGKLQECDMCVSGNGTLRVTSLPSTIVLVAYAQGGIDNRPH